MKIFSFIALLAIFTVLSCSGENSVNGNKSNSSGCTPTSKLLAKVSYEELDPSCRDEAKKFVAFSDSAYKEVNWDYVYSHLPGYVSGSGIVSESGGSGGYIVNGISMNQEEYDTYKKEYWRKYYEELDKKEIEIIPCVIVENVALLTDGEISELKEKYDKLTIEEHKKLDASCKIGERKVVYVHDSYYKYNDVKEPTQEDYDVCLGLSYEESRICLDNIKDKYIEELGEPKKRDLTIPCVFNDAPAIWGALLTDEDMAELEEKYDGLYIEDLSNPPQVVPGSEDSNCSAN